MAELPKPNPTNGAPPAAPRWVKVFGVVFAILVVLFVGLHLTGHSFGHHMHGH